MTCSENPIASAAMAPSHSGWVRVARANRRHPPMRELSRLASWLALACLSEVEMAKVNAEARLTAMTVASAATR